MAMASTPTHAQRLLRLLASAALGLCCWLVAGRAAARESNASVTNAESQLASHALLDDADTFANTDTDADTGTGTTTDATGATPRSGACDAAPFSFVSFASLNASMSQLIAEGHGGLSEDLARDQAREDVGPQCDRRAASVPVAARSRVLRIRAYFDQGSAPAPSVEEQHGALPEPDPSEASLLQSSAVDVWPAADARLPAPVAQFERGPVGLRVFLERPPR